MSSVRLAALAAIVGCASLWATAAQSQVFRVVGPDGKVTFTDRPPPDAKATAAATVAMPGAGTSTASLPAELRAAASRFPVTLYTSADCGGPCLSARSMLASRGVPFTEKTVNTEDDIAALQRLSGATRLPFATIGGQHVRGFAEIEWAEFLDAAGYPKTSRLPASFRNPQPTPLVAVQEKPAAPAATAAARAQQPARRAEAPAPSDPSPANPAGIRF